MRYIRAWRRPVARRTVTLGRREADVRRAARVAAGAAALSCAAILIRWRWRCWVAYPAAVLRVSGAR